MHFSNFTHTIINWRVNATSTSTKESKTSTYKIDSVDISGAPRWHLVFEWKKGGGDISLKLADNEILDNIYAIYKESTFPAYLKKLGFERETYFVGNRYTDKNFVANW